MQIINIFEHINLKINIMKLKKLLVPIFFFSFCLASFAQVENEIKEKKNAFAVSFGSPGLGLEYARKLSPKISAKLVWQSFNLKDFEQKDLEIKDDKVDLLANLEVSIIDLGIEYHPFKSSSFKLTTGFGILSNLNFNAVFTYKEDVVVGNVVVNSQDVGQIMADVSWSGLAPYLGLGFGRAIPKKKLGIGIEVGTYFASSPTVDLNASNLLSPTASQEENLQDALESFKFIPRIQLRLAYKF